jgi:hypothetical protein
MIDWGYWLDRKYANMEQDVANRGIGLRAAANLDNVRAGLLPKESAANIGLTNAQAGLAGANARNVEAGIPYVGRIAEAGIAETQNRGRLYGSQATGEDQLNQGMRGMFRLKEMEDFFGRMQRFGGGLFGRE